MDYTGQSYAEYLYSTIILSSAALGLLLATLMKNFNYIYYCLCLGSITAVIVASPSWPCFTRNPMRFRPLKKKIIHPKPEPPKPQPAKTNKKIKRNSKSIIFY
eukprot:UN01941